jgi:hypothetical protein
MQRPRRADLGLALVAVLTIAGLAAAGRPRQVLCTTFPIFQSTRNVVQGRDAITVKLLLPAGLGCPSSSKRASTSSRTPPARTSSRWRRSPRTGLCTATTMATPTPGSTGMTTRMDSITTTAA